ncbi:MAG: V-type ATP synthase subunit E [Candidatus Bathyarchaeota archaeon]|nr:V-type ATP synthase subunit E [Candidatus Bathyarchaeota archaeon]
MSVKTGIAAIASEVIGDVQKEAEALILAAQTEAKETLRIANDKARESYRAAVAQAKEKADVEKRKIASVAEVEARNRLLQTKEQLVDAAFEKATAALKEFAQSKNYSSYLLGLIEAVAQRMGQKKLVVQVNVKDKGWLTSDMLKTISGKIGSELELSNEKEDFIGGCKIQTSDGKIIYDATLDNKLAELTSALRVAVAKQLFGAA